jgi:adenine phosphoribosyltransferase
MRKDLTEANLKKSIRTIPDFPKKGVLFRDITPLLGHGPQFHLCICQMAKLIRDRADAVVSIESRGFILGSALAHALKIGFIPVRKEGKLPRKKHKASYDLEYGKAVIEMHQDALKKNSRVVIVDDVLATGGTARAAANLVKKSGAKIQGLYFLIELEKLGGRSKLKDYPVHSLIVY